MALKTKPLSEQVALVTGGGTGIGRALTEVLANAGAFVVIASRRPDVLKSTANQINEQVGSERVFGRAVDLRDRGQIDSLVSDV